MATAIFYLSPENRFSGIREPFGNFREEPIDVLKKFYLNYFIAQYKSLEFPLDAVDSNKPERVNSGLLIFFYPQASRSVCDLDLGITGCRLAKPRTGEDISSGLSNGVFRTFKFNKHGERNYLNEPENPGNFDRRKHFETRVEQYFEILKAVLGIENPKTEDLRKLLSLESEKKPDDKVDY